MNPENQHINRINGNIMLKYPVPIAWKGCIQGPGFKCDWRVEIMNPENKHINRIDGYTFPRNYMNH